MDNYALRWRINGHEKIFAAQNRARIPLITWNAMIVVSSSSDDVDGLFICRHFVPLDLWDWNVWAFDPPSSVENLGFAVASINEVFSASSRHDHFVLEAIVGHFRPIVAEIRARQFLRSPLPRFPLVASFVLLGNFLEAKGNRFFVKSARAVCPATEAWVELFFRDFDLATCF